MHISLNCVEKLEGKKMSEFDVVYVMLFVMCAIAATLGRLWWETRESLKWKSVECLMLDNRYKERNAKYWQLMKYKHVRAIAANIESGKARKK